MKMKNQKTLSIEELLEGVKGATGDEGTKKVLEDFVEHHLIGATGLILIWTEGKHTEISASRFSEAEAVWAISKAWHNVMSGKLSFND